MHFTPPFFGHNFTRFAQLLVTNAQHGWVSWQISLLVDESPLLNHFCEVFSIKLSADVLFLRKVSLEAAISL